MQNSERLHPEFCIQEKNLEVDFHRVQDNTYNSEDDLHELEDDIHEKKMRYIKPKRTFI